MDNKRTRLRRRIADIGELKAFGIQKSAIFREEELMAMLDELPDFEQPAADLPPPVASNSAEP